MNRLWERFKVCGFPQWTVPLALALLCLLSYGLLIPRLGYSWDDWAFLWTAKQLGPEGLQRYFSTNRPFWGALIQLTMRWMGEAPWQWQFFGLFWRWACAVIFWRLLYRLWPRQKQLAIWTSLVFVVYPGFGQQPIPINYGHFFLVLACLLASFFLTLASLRQKKGVRWLLTILALVFSAANLLMMEYFFLLELVRLPLIWVALANEDLHPESWQLQARNNTSVGSFSARLKAAGIIFTPYLTLFIVIGIWRAFFFRYQTQNYKPVLLQGLQSQPFQMVIGLVLRALGDLWRTTFGAWWHAFTLPNPAEMGARTIQIYGILVVVVLVASILYLLPGDEQKKYLLASTARQIMGVSLTSLVLAGAAFWLVGVTLGCDFPNSRFTIPFMLGSSLMLAGLLLLLPVPNVLRIVLFGLVVSFSSGLQFQDGNAFRRDWELQKALFWQLTWRAPGLERGTVLLFNDLPIRFSSDNSLTAPLNWIYAPDNHSEKMDYMLYATSIRLGRALIDLQPGLPIEQNYLAARFSGDTSQAVAFYFQPPGCLRSLDPEIDPQNLLIPPLLRQAAKLSRLDLILPGQAGSGVAAIPPKGIFGAELAHGWCYYFEEADLARQLGDWQRVGELGDQAFRLSDYPNDPIERFPFIEGYAHLENWQRAIELTVESGRVSPLVAGPICMLWKRIDRDTPSSPAKDAALLEMHGEIACESVKNE